MSTIFPGQRRPSQLGGVQLHWPVAGRTPESATSVCFDPLCSVTTCEGFVNPEGQPRAGINVQVLPCQAGQPLTRSNGAMDDGNLANDPVQCGQRHPWTPGHVIVCYLPCACRADEGISGHTMVHCTTDSCRSAWYRPRHYPPDATPSHGAGEPSGEPLSPDAGRSRAH
jgi:hypothetical protein